MQNYELYFSRNFVSKCKIYPFKSRQHW